MDSEDLLTSFRQEWKRELENSSRENPLNSEHRRGSSNTNLYNSNTLPENRVGIHSDVEVEAADLFSKGVQLEQNGQLYESIRFYRKAISLVPDIELRVHNQNIQERVEEYNVNDREGEEAELDDLGNADLVSRFENLRVGAEFICEPQFPQDAAHLCCLPAEMVEKILYWLVGSELDLESLERVASVSRGLYLICRKQDIWRKSCVRVDKRLADGNNLLVQLKPVFGFLSAMLAPGYFPRVWGINTGEMKPYSSWRDMFIWRPRPRFNGCYISKTTYFRSGENSFQDLSYQPWHFVCYYRYLRFFPQGQVLMLTSSEEPQSIVSHLKKLESKHPQVLVGHFRIHGNSVTMLFRKANNGVINNKRWNRCRGQGTTDVSGTTFQMELEVKAVRGRPHWQLVWRCYSVVSTYQNGSHTTSVVNVADLNNFPPLSFSKVKSYSSESDFPLF